MQYKVQEQNTLIDQLKMQMNNGNSNVEGLEL